ncbi:MAG: flavin reductase family protein [Acidimicrobiaceae bacterium]|nr:flavin reductase family protein [Acidimicrobiaceae bacterium]MCY3644067.1 flavin reductase family protein [Acidimicrobiaceae bacterium]MDE0494863.1 flavin reductase family protein [Acidimicrobiaceae bacterium]MDE0665253.1 flavin reductase family protein [Acidimicrobiaceae bacterium]MXY12373.1 flavin reductase family protein [Acidimicrobiaceae bacterium]
MGSIRGGNEPIDGQEFRRVLGHYPTGVTVVTAACPGGPEGMTIGSFTSVSLDPPLVSFCPGHDSDSWIRMRDVGSFCVNVLGDDQSGVSTTFASKVDDRFDGLRTRVEATGAPVIEGCRAWIDCHLEAVHVAGDHDIVVGRVVALGTSGGDGESESGPLIFLKGGYGRVAGL